MEGKFEREYFEGKAYLGIYRDFPCHYLTTEKVLERKPVSALEIGGARGFVSRLLDSRGVPTMCMDISEYCYQNRAIDKFVKHDATKAPYPFRYKEYDLCFSVAVLEHIPEHRLDSAIAEMARVSKRGLHGVTFTIESNDIDKTHVTMHSKDWWIERFSKVAPNYSVEIVDKEELENGVIDLTKVAPWDGLVKLNVGSFMDMFHYGWINLDLLDLHTFAQKNGYIFQRCNVITGLPYPNDSVDVILASHLLEHFSREDGKNFLRECLRVLKDDGVLRLAVPNSKQLADAYLKGEIKKLQEAAIDNSEDDADALFHILLDGHKTIYDSDGLRKILEGLGFVAFQYTTPFVSYSKAIEKQTVPLHPSISAYVEVRAKKKR